MKVRELPEGGFEFDGTPAEIAEYMAVVGRHRTVRDEPAAKSRSRSGESLPKRILAIMSKAGNRDVEVKTIAEELPDEDPTAISSAINRMSKAANAKVDRVSHGVYRMKT